jgi:hypothetical protein
MTDGLGSRPIPDLRNIALEELVVHAQDDDGPIHDIVARMVDDGDGQPPASATMFQSAI